MNLLNFSAIYPDEARCKARLPFRYWFAALYLPTLSGENFSAKELQH
jgi:hypothetical protein